MEHAPRKLADFNIEKPLWVFVGNTVSGEESDILDVVNFLADFLNSEAQIKIWLADLIADRAQILDAKGNNISADASRPDGFSVAWTNSTPTSLLRVFNASARQRLKLVNIKSSKGELALRVGDAEPFGLINIGDDAGFFGMAEDVGLRQRTRRLRRRAVRHTEQQEQPPERADRLAQIHGRLEQLARVHRWAC